MLEKAVMWWVVRGDVLLVITSVVGVDGGTVMTVSGGQGAVSPKQVTLARCTQSEFGERKNCRVSSGIMVPPGMHTLTRDVQELMIGLIIAVTALASSAWMVCTPIPHCGQLNITISTLHTPVKSGVSRKSKVMSVLEAVFCIVIS